MSTTARNNPFRGQAKAGEDYKTEIPSEETHDARIIALVDLGTHSESFKGEAPSDKRKCLVAFELDEEMTGMKGVNHVVTVEYTMSFHELAKLRLLAESILNDGKKFPTEGEESNIDYERLLGQPCTVQVGHTTKTTDKGDRTYVKIGTISAVAKKKREKFFAPKREVTSWYIGDDLDALPPYLPKLWGEDVKVKIGRSKEMGGKGGKATPETEDEGDVGGEEPTPF